MPAKKKCCWVAKETKKGWRLYLAVGPTDHPVSGILIGDEKGIMEILNMNVVYVHLKGCTCKSVNRKKK